MAYKKTDKLIQYNNNYNRENYDRINLIVKKGMRELIKARADADGMSVNALINKALESYLNDPQFKT